MGLTGYVVDSVIGVPAGGESDPTEPAARRLEVLLEQFLYEVDPMDPGAFLLIALAVGAVATGASWLPARRAARVDPVSVLNAE